MSVDLKQFYQTFFEESFEGLDSMESELLALDAGSPNVEVVNTIFRAAHSIKGGAGTFGFTAVASFTHVVETVLDQMRAGTRQVTPEAISLLLNSVDCMRDMLNAVRDEADLDMQRVSSLQSELEELLGGHESGGTAAGQAVEAAPAAVGWKIGFRPHAGMLCTGNDPLRMFRELEALGELSVSADSSALPAFKDLMPEDSYLGWELELAGDVPEAQVREVFDWVEDECDLQLTPLLAEQEPPAGDSSQSPRLATGVEESAKPPASGQRGQQRSKTETGSIRVGIDKVDAIINMVGELVITQSMLGQLGEQLEDADTFEAVQVEKLRDGLVQLERTTRELQEGVMRIRMLPINFVFNRFPRLVHDLSRQLHKKIELKLSGEQTELDKTVMEKIGDPLVHLVRNSLDHGIESPEQRRAAGKPETGVLHLNAYHKGGNIVIEISDDGAGINKEKVLQKARERGLVADDEALSDERIYDLIFQPGFSTAEEVSDLSGRGVGMDVVRRNIKALGGSIEVHSEPGQGSRFCIRLPLTLAILDGQLVRVGGNVFVIPLVSIIESLQINTKYVNSIAGRADVYQLRDEYIPITRLDDVFNVGADSTDLAGELMVVVEGDGHKAGLVVDDLLSQQQVVIKSLETNFKPVEGLSGATILGDGTVALILDVAGLINFSRNNEPGKPKPPYGKKNGEHSGKAQSRAA